MYKLNFIILVLVLLLLLSCHQKNSTEPPNENIHLQVDIPWPSLANSPWPAAHGNMQCNGRSKFQGPREGKVCWTFSEERFVNESSGVVIGSDGTIYFTAGTMENNRLCFLYALNPDGSLKWKLELEGKFASTPLVGAGDIIYVPTYYGSLYAVNFNGTIKWKYGTAVFNWTFSPAIGLEGTIYFADKDGKIYAINSDDGTLKWLNTEKAKTSGTVTEYYSIAISPDGTALYIASSDNNIIAINAQTGAILWEYSIGKFLIASPLIDSDGNIYFIQTDSTGNYICSLNSKGEFRWKGDTKIHPTISLHIDKNGNIYAMSQNFCIVSFDYDGNFRWSSAKIEDVWISSIIGDSDGIIYCACSYAYIYALDQNGTQLFRCNLPVPSDWLMMGALSGNGHLYLSGKYQLFCIK